MIGEFPNPPTAVQLHNLELPGSRPSPNILSGGALTVLCASDVMEVVKAYPTNREK